VRERKKKVSFLGGAATGAASLVFWRFACAKVLNLLFLSFGVVGVGGWMIGGFDDCVGHTKEGPPSGWIKKEGGFDLEGGRKRNNVLMDADNRGEDERH